MKTDDGRNRSKGGAKAASPELVDGQRVQEV
jgi:hypothetical protein